jgi:DMSO/TMAO reductase YedYZ molybdopterin-dependent catalytic subunit
MLLVALLGTFATGPGAVATGSAHGRWVVIAHGVVATAVTLLVPWKGRVIRYGLRRSRPSRWASLLLAVLASVALLAGFGYASGVVLSIAGLPGMWIHVAAALGLVPLLLWHIVARGVRPRATDLSRRTMLRTGVIGAGAVGIYVALAATVRVTGLPGRRRRFTGSYEAGSYDPPSMPSTIWLDDRTPTVDPQFWRLTIVDAEGRYEQKLADLSARAVPVRATLDCTSGWYAHQTWSAVPVSALLRGTARNQQSARSLYVHSVTGYWVRLPIGDLDQLWLATGVGGQPLSAAHGFPLRLIAPDRRGFWWVKWVDRIELQTTPSWWQPPFPVT